MKYVYFYNEYNENDIINKFGKKGTYLSEITNLGLNVPKGFVITTDGCNEFYENNKQINNDMITQINEYISKLENITGKKFGDKNNPLLLSIKCSPKNEVPSIMNKIINIGLTEEIVENLSKNTNEFIWIWEYYFNFINDYAKNVTNIDLESYEDIKNFISDKNNELTIEELRIFLSKIKKEYQLKTKREFQDNPKEQLYSIINKAFMSWNNERANIYRRDADIPFKEGIAICIQSMFFENINKNYKIETIYTRDPQSGEQLFKKENSSQSEEYSMYPDDEILNETLLAEQFPEIYSELKNISILLEKHYKDMLKIDFVIENGKLFIIEVCKGKRSARAALKIACDFSEKKNDNNDLTEQNNTLTKIKTLTPK